MAAMTKENTNTDTKTTHRSASGISSRTKDKTSINTRTSDRTGPGSRSRGKTSMNKRTSDRTVPGSRTKGKASMNTRTSDRTGPGSRSNDAIRMNKQPTDMSALNSRIIDGIALGISLALLAAAAAGAAYTKTGGTVLEDFLRILLTPSPAVTDYFSLGSLPATLLNVGLCGLAMSLFMILLPGPSHGNTLAGYFLVIAHCFFGLHFLNIWPCFLTPFLYMAVRRLDFKDNLHVNMFATCFGPFISELLLRYTLGARYTAGEVHPTVSGVLLTLLFALAIGFAVPAALPGAKSWHKGYNLYNAGIACGVLGFVFYSLFYRITGAEAPVIAAYENAVYESFGHSYQLFGNLFFLILSAICLVTGWALNGRSFRGIRRLFGDTGYESNFVKKYGMPLCLINIGLYCPLVLVYTNLAMILTEGVGFTAPIYGAVFAALTFTAIGQHPRNVWPIFAGYPLLYLLAIAASRLLGTSLPWTISSQGYMMSAAFATGLCPLVGRYGSAAGVAAGMLAASICSYTATLHGGLMLYNSGFTAGIAALFLLPILEHYVKGPRVHMNQRVSIDPRDMITVEDRPDPPKHESDQPAGTKHRAKRHVPGQAGKIKNKTRRKD